ncbi:unnamed protein product [Calypogeia fissa]
MEAERLFVELEVQQNQDQSKEDLQQKATDSAINKEGKERGICKLNSEVASSGEEQGRGNNPTLGVGEEGELVRDGGGVSLQSHDAGIAINNVDSNDLTQSSCKPHISHTPPPSSSPSAAEAKAATLGEYPQSGSLARGQVDRYALRPRSIKSSTTAEKKKHNLDHPNNSQLLHHQFSEVGTARGGRKGVEEIHRSIWGRKKRRTDRRCFEVPQVTPLPESNPSKKRRTKNSPGRSCAEIHHGRSVKLHRPLRACRGKQNSKYSDCYTGREALSLTSTSTSTSASASTSTSASSSLSAQSAPKEAKNEVSVSSRTQEKQRGRSVQKRVGKITTGPSRSAVRRIDSPCKQPSRRVTRSSGRMVTHTIGSSPSELTVRHEGIEGSAAMAANTPQRKKEPPVRKRKASPIPADGFADNNGLLTNWSRQRSASTQRPVAGDELAEYSRAVLSNFPQHTPPRTPLSSANRQSQALQQQQIEAILNPQLTNSDAFGDMELGRSRTPMHGSEFNWGRTASSSPASQDFGAYIGSRTPPWSQLGGGAQNRDVFSIGSQPSPNGSLGTPQSDARQSSDEDYRPPAGHSPYHYGNHNNGGAPIPPSSYPSRSRRSLPFNTDGVPPQRMGSIFASPSDFGAHPAPPYNNGTYPPSNMSPVLQHGNSVQDHQNASFGTNSVSPRKADAGMAVLEGVDDEDYDPEDGNLVDDDDEEGEHEEEGLLDLNQPFEKQKQPRKNSKVRKKHRPKVTREGRPDGRRKPKNGEEGVPKTTRKKATEGTKTVANPKPRGRKKRVATTDLNSAQGDDDLHRNQGDYAIPVVANSGPRINGCGWAQRQDTSRHISDAGRSMHSQDHTMQSEGRFFFLHSERPQTPPSELEFGWGPNNSSIPQEVFGDPNFPNNAGDCSALGAISEVYGSPSPSRKRGSEVEHQMVLHDSPVRRELFKMARSKGSPFLRKNSSGQEERYQESLMQTDATTHSQEFFPIQSMVGNALCGCAAEGVGAVMSVHNNASNSEEGVSVESSIISTEMNMPNGSASIAAQNVASRFRRMRAAARAKAEAKARNPDGTIRVKRKYERRAPFKPRRSKQTDISRGLEMVVRMDSEEIDSGLQLVLHVNQNKAIIPFMPMRRKKPRARVMLDGEDKRVWRLLMTQGTKFEDDASEKEAPRQWDEERAIMKARAEKFINRMHLVQGDRRFSVWKGSVVDSVVGAFLTQNVSDHLSSSAFMCLAARFPVARKQKPAAGTSQEATVTEVQVEEAYEISLTTEGDPTCSDGAEAAQEGRMTAYHVEEVCDASEIPETPTCGNGLEAAQDGTMTDYHVEEEACDVSEKSSATGEGSSMSCNQQAHDTLSTKLADSEDGREPTSQILGSAFQEHTQDTQETKRQQVFEEALATGEGSPNQQANDTLSTKVKDSEGGREPTTQTLGSAFQEHTQETKQQYSSEERSADTREQNSSCSSKASPRQCDSFVHATPQAEDSLEVRDSEEKQLCAVLEDDAPLHLGPEVVLLPSSDLGHHLNSIDSTPLEEDLGELLASSDPGHHLNFDFTPLGDVDNREVTDVGGAAPSSWFRGCLLDGEVSLCVDLTPNADDHMTDKDSRIQANNFRTHEIGGNPMPLDKNCFSGLPAHDVTCASAEEIGFCSSSVVSSSDSLDANKLSQSSATTGDELRADTGGVTSLVDSFDTNNSNDQQLVIASQAEPSLGQLQPSPLRAIKTMLRGKDKVVSKGSKSFNGKNNSELVNTAGDDQEKEGRGRKKRPVISLTGIARARLEQSNITSKVEFDWEAVRLKYTEPAEMGENQHESGHESAHAGSKSFGSSEVENGVDWDAVRSAELEAIADVIKERGMNNVLAGRIKAFLERVHKEHGSVDLEWLRKVGVEEAKSFLLSIRGLGLKSVECIRLLTLHHLAFPVDTNVGRICVRLGWVPLEPLPEELQLHLLELYPVQETIQKYLWPRLCTLDQRTLYELHYQMITFGKVFCTKSRPNCNACPMRDDCQHFASALASARLALPGAAHEDSHPTNSEPLALPAAVAEFVKKEKLALQASGQDEVATGEEGVESPQLSSYRLPQKPCEPIVEEPRTPEPEIGDIEDFDPCCGVSSQQSASDKGSSSEMEFVLPHGEVSISKAMVVLPPDSASIPVPQLKNVGRLRTVHYVYELPDSHPLVQKMDPREDDDPCFYLLAIWSPGESPDAPPALDDMYTNGTCDGFNSSDEETVKGTVLVPCRTAMRGIFPLNGTYFQVNEVFADHASSIQPIEVPRTLLWNLRRRFVYFGTSVTSIFKGLSTEEIQACFWRGYVCVRGFDNVSRCPRPLAARLHFPASKMTHLKLVNCTVLTSQYFKNLYATSANTVHGH